MNGDLFFSILFCKAGVGLLIPACCTVVAIPLLLVGSICAKGTPVGKAIRFWTVAALFLAIIAIIDLLQAFYLAVFGRLKKPPIEQTEVWRLWHEGQKDPTETWWRGIE